MRSKRWTDENIRHALATAERLGCRELVLSVIALAVEDLNRATGRELESAATYFSQLDGELEHWHAELVGLEPAALRRRARRALEDRFGAARAGQLWEPAEPDAGAPPRPRQPRGRFGRIRATGNEIARRERAEGVS